MQAVNFKKISAFETPGQSPGFLLWQISTTWRGAIERVLKQVGLTHPQFVILAAVGWLTREGDRISQASIGKLAGLDPNTVSQIIQGLEKKKLLVREASSDGRAKNPILTKMGSEILHKAMPLVETADAGFFKALTHQEQESMIGIFQKLTSHPES